MRSMLRPFQFARTAKIALSQSDEIEQGARCLWRSRLRTRDDRQLIRPISARYMHAKEIAAYEKASPETQDQ